MNDLTEQQFNRLTQVQKVEMVMEVFNRRSQDNLDAYETYCQEEESDEEARINSELLSKVLADLFEETMEILSQMEEANMYDLCQHFGATDPSFKLEMDQLYPADESYWTGKKLNGFKLNDVSTAIDKIKGAMLRLSESPLRALILEQQSED
ncbi:MAG: hypothetical protein WAS25_09595 [Geothrix sp.]|uniref:hypothetical protein n=1 Tax=Geothrix sp. TaxID=1962974 RepID=UPI003BB20ABB